MTAAETISTVDPADWVTIWQSEMAALAVDPECTAAMLLWGQAWVSAFDKPARGTGSDAPAGAAPAGAAPGAEREGRSPS